MSHWIGMVLLCSGCLSLLLTIVGITGLLLPSHGQRSETDATLPPAIAFYVWRIVKFPAAVLGIELGLFLTELSFVGLPIRAGAYFVVGAAAVLVLVAERTRDEPRRIS